MRMFEQLFHQLFHQLYKRAFRFAAISVLVCLLILSGCKSGNSGGEPTPGEPTQPSEPVPTFTLNAEGAAATLEIATWNLHNFPSSDTHSIPWVVSIIRQLDLDVLALQEISDMTAFQQLVDRLKEYGYDGIYSPDSYSDGSYQKTGIIYKTAIISIQSQESLFTDDSYAFPRPPFLLGLTAQKDSGPPFDFYLMIIHLKAFDDAEAIDRRRSACTAMKNYMDQRIAVEAEQDYIVAGDWNDEVDDLTDVNSFNAFIDDPQAYRFVTTLLAPDDQQASFPSWPSLIDHILIANDCETEYTGGTVKTLRLDDSINDYAEYVSDHRPVMAVFPVFQ